MDLSGQNNFQQGFAKVEEAPVTVNAPPANQHLIGEVMEVTGSGARVLLDAKLLNQYALSSDPALAMAGQVGAQIKIRVGAVWLLASIRTQAMYERGEGMIVAQIDFMGEGDEEKLTGKIYKFRRGVTRYPVPGSDVFAATSGFISMRCWASISRCWGPPAPVNRPAPRSSSIASVKPRPKAIS